MTRGKGKRSERKQRCKSEYILGLSRALKMLRNTALRSTTPLLRTPVLRASYSVVGPRKMLITPSECTESTLFLDASWHMPNLSPPRHAAAEHASLRIPGSQFWSVDEIAESSPLGLSHMLPSPQRLAEALGKMGIEKGREIVVYDSVGVFSSPRTAFTFAVRCPISS